MPRVLELLAKRGLIPTVGTRTARGPMVKILQLTCRLPVWNAKPVTISPAACARSTALKLS